jgi:hypothetical protein
MVQQRLDDERGSPKDRTATMSMDMQDQVARIQRMQEETRKFAAEVHKLTDETRKTGASRPNGLLGLQIALAGTFTGAALVFIMAFAMIKFARQ